MSKFILEDRYTATGTPYPDENSCNNCDGMGLFPCQAKNIDAEALKTKDGTIIVIGQKDEDGNPMEFDGWLIVRCPVCNGTKKLAPPVKEEK